MNPEFHSHPESKKLNDWHLQANAFLKNNDFSGALKLVEETKRIYGNNLNDNDSSILDNLTKWAMSGQEINGLRELNQLASLKEWFEGEKKIDSID